MPTIRIFLSSPGDVYVERQAARRILEKLKHDPLLKGEIDLEIVAWDDPHARTLMPVSMTPQQAIDRGLPRPAMCDIVVVLFWARMGTPLDAEKHGTKPTGEPFSSGTEWEYLDAMTALEANKTGLPIVYLYHRTDTPPLPDAKNLEGLKEYITQQERVQVFFSQFRDPITKAYKGNVHEYDTPDKFEELFEVDARLLVREAHKLRTGKVSPPVAAKPTWDGSPFPGLRAFTPKDKPIFFGRGRETAELVKRLTTTSFVAIVGASGSGKSSLVGAGLIPQLKDDAIPGSRYWHIVQFTPGNAPYQRLAEALIKTVPEFKGDVIDYRVRSEKLASNLRKASDNLEKLLNYTFAHSPVKVLLFIDQFEELLTLTPPDQQSQFAEMLTQAGEHVHIVLTLRADFYHQAINVDKSLTELLQKSSYPLGAPDDITLYEMILRPAERAGLRFEGELARQLVCETGGEPGALALLAYLLDELYHQRTADGQLTFQAYTDLGGVRGAISKRAETVFNGLDAETQAMLPRIFHALVEVDERGTATRQRAALAKVTPNEAAQRLVEALTQARLLVQDEQAGQPIVEVAHETLLRSWTRLAHWIETTQDDLRLLRQVRLAAADWEQHGWQEAFRWPDERLQPVYAMIEHLGLKENYDFNEVERAFIYSEFARLLEELRYPDISHQRRSWIGERLCTIGDRRKGVGLGADGLPEFDWCKVEVEHQASHRVKVNLPFYIARYPVTYRQFQAFLEAEDGFIDPRWREGLVADDESMEMRGQCFQFDNHPRENVNWYQAMAFCRWLSYRLGSSYDLKWVMDWSVRLPTETEWQLAALGGNDKFSYPWGKEWNGGFANTRESGLSRTTAVGMYPPGVARCGALDMVGNVWEWCLNDYDSVSHSKSTIKVSHVSRGGSWNSNVYDASATARNVYYPNFRSDLLGFRVCSSSPAL